MSEWVLIFQTHVCLNLSDPFSFLLRAQPGQIFIDPPSPLRNAHTGVTFCRPPFHTVSCPDESAIFRTTPCPLHVQAGRSLVRSTGCLPHMYFLTTVLLNVAAPPHPPTPFFNPLATITQNYNITKPCSETLLHHQPIKPGTVQGFTSTISYEKPDEPFERASCRKALSYNLKLNS